MRAKSFVSKLLLFPLVFPLALAAKQTDTEFRQLADIRAKAEKGDPQSQFELGKVFYSGALGVDTDYGEAVKWYRKAADQNHAEAQDCLGVCYAKGQGVWKDESMAVKWFRKAAEQNVAEAQYGLA